MSDQQENTASSQEDAQAGNTPRNDTQDSSGQGSSTDQAQGGQDTRDSSTNQSQDSRKPETSSDSSQATDTQERAGEKDQVDADDDLESEDLEALDAKVRRKVSKVNRENSNLRDRLATAEQSTREATQRADRAEAALAAGLPHSALKYLTGDTAEELEANAEELLVLLGYGHRVTPSSLPRQVGGSQDAAVSQVEDLDSIGSRIFKH